MTMWIGRSSGYVFFHGRLMLIEQMTYARGRRSRHKHSHRRNPHALAHQPPAFFRRACRFYGDVQLQLIATGHVFPWQRSCVYIFFTFKPVSPGHSSWVSYISVRYVLLTLRYSEHNAVLDDISRMCGENESNLIL